MPKKITKSEPAEKTADGYSVADLAGEFDMDATQMRVHLRVLEVEKPGSRWVWPKKTDSGLQAIRSQIKDRLKELASKPASEKPKGKAASGPKKRLKKAA